jgi:serine-type D-Ala-D-Ala carboxypeptidase/endopeptidase (penicillin-binding protein 4)
MVRSYFLLLFAFLLLLQACAPYRNIAKQAKSNLLHNKELAAAHIGICVYEPATGKYWYVYNEEKYFVPASNTKLFTLYAGLKYLGDSLPGMRYLRKDGMTYLFPTGDPSFLHPGFSHQPVYDFLKKEKQPLALVDQHWKTTALGAGWAWDDYTDDYMVERSPLPMYNNWLRVGFVKDTLRFLPYDHFDAIPSREWTTPLMLRSRSRADLPQKFAVRRFREMNAFEYTPSNTVFTGARIPFIADAYTVLSMLADTLKTDRLSKNTFRYNFSTNDKPVVIHSQPADAVFTPMMHRSDNFFAEQILLMAANEHLGLLDEKQMIDTLLKTDLAGIPHRPKWVDGSGLSRYNLCTPNSLVWLLDKMKNEFGLERLQKILPTGGTGTLRNLYKADSGYIFAKTGTLSNHTALSGYLITRKKRLLIFSVLTNHYMNGAAPARAATERFLHALRERY